MRINSLIVVMFLILISPLSARNETRAINLQGAYGDVAEVYIEAVPAQSQMYVSGMPFSIEDSTVQPGATSTGGRYIADWSFITNTKVNLYIRGEYLTSVNPTPDGEYAKLPYKLKFDYELAYVDNNGDSSSESATFSYSNGAGETYYKYEIIPGIANKSGSFLGSLDGSVYFEFLNKVDNTISYDELPVGDYKADVYVVLEAAG